MRIVCQQEVDAPRLLRPDRPDPARSFESHAAKHEWLTNINVQPQLVEKVSTLILDRSDSAGFVLSDAVHIRRVQNQRDSNAIEKHPGIPPRGV